MYNDFSRHCASCSIVTKRLKYFLDAANYMDWAINLSALFYVLPPAGCPCKSPHQMEAAAVCLFLGWLNLVLYLRRSADLYVLDYLWLILF